ncbi:MAG: lipopolysaccharide biosynthesis protein [Candidatus Omnitrophica bacterium]|nr:lipopolysaccharide biosynthesis protein [Candidatus Omnitrophota bacterium]
MNNKWNSFINNQSIKTRFLTTLCANIARVGLSFIGGIVIARTLEPSGYGNFNFLLGSFASIVALLDMGTSSAFYTFLSQRKQGAKFYLYYFLWIGIQFIFVLSLIGFIFPHIWRDKIWLGHSKGLIILAFVASFMMSKVWETITHVGESIRATVTVQLHNIVIAGLYLCIVSAMVFLHLLTIPNLFIIITFTYLLSSFKLAKSLKDNVTVSKEVKLTNMFNEFKTYCAPLVAFSIVGFVYQFADLWLLQKFGGAVQQGFYSVGLRFSAICAIASSSMLKVLWKEVAEANELGNKERLYYLYIKISRGLYFVGAIGACFLVPFSKEILVFFLGPKYGAGWFCLAIMFLYPIHSALGHVNGVYYLATAQSKLRSQIGIVTMLVSIPVTYFVLAPSSSIIPGLGLGSIGLALKMMILQIIGVNILAYFICRLSRWRFDFLYQFEIIGFLLIVSFAIKGFLSWFFRILDVSFHPLLLAIPCVPIYVLMAGLILYLFPTLAGLERVQVTNFIPSVYRFLKTKWR